MAETTDPRVWFEGGGADPDRPVGTVYVRPPTEPDTTQEA